MEMENKAIALASHSILEMIQTLYFSSRIRHLAFVGAGIYIHSFLRKKINLLTIVAFFSCLAILVKSTYLTIKQDYCGNGN